MINIEDKNTVEMKENLARIGQIATTKTDKFESVEVEILLFKKAYGRTRWLVKPVAGSGEAWVENVEFINDEQDEILEY